MKKYLRYVITTLVVTAIVGGYFYWQTMSGQVEENPISDAILAVAHPYPELTGAKEITLNCDYHGEALSVSETLYSSLNTYYSTNPYKVNAFWAGDVSAFVFSYEKDPTIADLVDKIEAIGAEKSLTSDQTVDLAACFLQSIPYDQPKADLVLSTDTYNDETIPSVIPRYPYETLYDETGICTDKTYLGAAVMGELGYETAILTFDEEQHMTLGVAVPDGYGSFGTDYGILELTGEGFLVGDIPELDTEAGSAVYSYEIISADDVGLADNYGQLSSPDDIAVASEGESYTRIIERSVLLAQLEAGLDEIYALEEEYNNLESILSYAESELDSAEALYESYPSDYNYYYYLGVYDNYSDAYDDVTVAIDSYNAAVDLYNGYVEEYERF